MSETAASDAVVRRHAEYQLKMLAEADTTWAQRTNTEWLKLYGRKIGDIRAALDWAFSRPGQERLALDLSNAALPVMFELSLGEECRRRAGQALVLLGNQPEKSRYDEMRLRSVLAAAQMYTPGPSKETIETCKTVVRLAQELEFPPAESRALWGLWTGYSYAGEPLKALDLAYRLNALADRIENEPRQLMAERIIGTSLHAIGRHAEAAGHLFSMIARYDPSLHRFRTLGFPTDHGVLAQTTLALVQWMLGRPITAAREKAIPLEILSGDLDGAEGLLDELQALAASGGIAIWQAGGMMALIVVEASRGRSIESAAVSGALHQLRVTGYRAHQAWLTAVLAECLGERERPDEGLLLVREALALCLTSGQRRSNPTSEREKILTESRPPFPPFTRETAIEKVRAAENAWNTCNPGLIAPAYTAESLWRNRNEFVQGRPDIVALLSRKWARELEYRLIKELWAFTDNRIAVRFAYECRDTEGQWCRAYGNENWEFDANGLMRARHASINDLTINQTDRLFHWDRSGPRPADHPSLSDLGL